MPASARSSTSSIAGGGNLTGGATTLPGFENLDLTQRRLPVDRRLPAGDPAGRPGRHRDAEHHPYSRRSSASSRPSPRAKAATSRPCKSTRSSSSCWTAATTLLDRLLSATATRWTASSSSSACRPTCPLELEDEPLRDLSRAVAALRRDLQQLQGGPQGSGRPSPAATRPPCCVAGCARSSPVPRWSGGTELPPAGPAGAGRAGRRCGPAPLGSAGRRPDRTPAAPLTSLPLLALRPARSAPRTAGTLRRRAGTPARPANRPGDQGPGAARLTSNAVWTS